MLTEAPWVCVHLCHSKENLTYKQYTQNGMGGKEDTSEIDKWQENKTAEERRG